MSRRSTFSALALAASLFLIALPAVAENARSTSAAQSVCPGVSRDATSPAMKVFLDSIVSAQPVGDVSVSESSGQVVKTQEFAVTDDKGATSTVSVECSATGCISPCATVGCNPTTILGQPACSGVQCIREGGTPCAIQASCSKKVTQTGTSTGTGTVSGSN